MLLSRAALLLWLGPSLRVFLPRLLARWLRRAATGEELFAGNRETFGHLLPPDSLLHWARPTTTSAAGPSASTPT